MKPEARSQKPELNGYGHFDQAGFQIIKSLVEPDECDLFSGELTPVFERQQKISKSKIGGVRNLLRNNLRVLQFANSPKPISILESVVGSNFFPVRAIFFDKNPEANWSVPWHQDLAIAVEDQIQTPGFTGWSVKDGTLHVHPPEEVLANMVTLRLHLDDCDAGNGALKVIAGSHLAGKIPSNKISRWVGENEQTVCEIRKGGVLLMRPLLLHSSSPAESPRHRRVLHIEYATQELPNGLKWFDN
jgi:hypothetical protein